MGRGRGESNLNSINVLFSTPLDKRDILKTRHKINANDLLWYQEIASKDFLEFIEFENIEDVKFCQGGTAGADEYKRVVAEYNQTLSEFKSKLKEPLKNGSRVDLDVWKKLSASYKELLTSSYKRKIREAYPEAFKKFKTVDKDFPTEKVEIIGKSKNVPINYLITKITLIDPQGEAMEIREDIVFDLFYAVELRETGHEEDILCEIEGMPLRLEDVILDKEYQKEIKILLEKGYIEKSEIDDNFDGEKTVYMPTEKCLELYKINAAYFEKF